MNQAAELASREAKKPFVRFERIPVEDKAATLAAGHYVAKDVDYALVTPPYSKDVFKQKVKDWFAQLERDVAAGRLPEIWVHDYKKMYQMWQNGQELPLSGTPIKGWGVISPAMQETLIHMHILTVESLAEINEEGIRRIGMGAVDLKNKAVAWLSTMKDKGATTLEISELKKENASLKASVQNLENLVNELRKSQDVTVSRETGSISASDIIEDERTALVKDYTAKFGKAPHHLMKTETIRAKLAE